MKQTKFQKGRTVVKEKLVENVAKYPHNLQAVFRLTAKQCKVKKRSVEDMYYRHVRNSGDVLFMTITSQGALINTKQCEAIKEGKRTLTLSESLIDLTNLSTIEKAAMFDLMLGN
jgi:hypothetical protein